MFDFRNIYKKKHGVNEIEIEEVLLDNLKQKKEGEEFSEQRIEVPLSSKILRIFYGVFLLIIALVAIKSFELQVLLGDEMQKAAEQNAVRNIPLAPNRGVLYDSSFLQLAFNRPSFDFVCNKFNMPSTPKEKEDILKNASLILNISFDELKDEIQKNFAPRILIKENLSHEELVLLESRLSEFEGCSIQENIRREYAEGSLFAHLLGYMAKISAQEVSELQ